jgi:NAD(P)-dependent dehydrogenase (short-subunit alcohol dehydrogenase family)
MELRSKPLAGKVALITGGARRLGRASAFALAQDGADVAITFLESGREAQRVTRQLEHHGARALATHCDVTDRKSVKAAVREVARKLGGIDILVNNAGTYETVSFDDLTLRQWDGMFAVNVRGPFLVTKEAFKYLQKSQGRIINLGSLGALRAWPMHLHYCCSKAALHMLTKAMAKALAPEITVNCVAPGMIDLGEKSSFRRRMAKATPMLRNGSADDVAEAVRFFARAPRFITGQILVVDGGLGL